MADGPRFPECVPTLTDGVVRLRAHAPSDTPRIVEQGLDPESLAWTTVPRPYTPAAAADYPGTIEAGWNDPGGARSWAITQADGPFLGTIDLRPHPGRAYEVGFGAHPAGRGRGVVSRALRLAVTWAFDTGAQAIRWKAFIGNWSSLNVARACGFGYDGVVRANAHDGAGGLRDTWVATLLAGEPLVRTSGWPSPTIPSMVPVIDLAELRLRPWVESDVPAVDEGPDADSLANMPAGVHPGRQDFPGWLARTRARIATGDAVQWCIADRTTDRALGAVLVFGLGPRDVRFQGEVGYWLHPPARGHGLVGRALPAVLAHCFAPVAAGGLGLSRLHAATAVTNAGSRRILRRTGFREWGWARAAWRDALGELIDEIHFDLLASEFRAGDGPAQ